MSSTKKINQMSIDELRSECVHLRNCYFSIKNILDEAKSEHIIKDLPFLREIKSLVESHIENADTSKIGLAVDMMEHWIKEMENS